MKKSEIQIPDNFCGLALIGGSSAYRLLEQGKFQSVSASRIAETPFGNSAPLHFVSADDAGISFVFISRHGERGYSVIAPDVNYRANIYALKEIGTRWIMSWSGPGSLNKDYSPGDLVLPDDLLDFTSGRKSTFFSGSGIGFIRQWPVFCPQMRVMLSEVCSGLGIEMKQGGTYAVTQGPRLETPAEIRMLATLGADLVGMTLAPEVFLARELEMSYHPLCYVTNMAEGVQRAEYRGGELFEGMLSTEEREAIEGAVDKFPLIAAALAGLIARSAPDQAESPFAKSMDRYRRDSRLGDDWRTWPFN